MSESKKYRSSCLLFSNFPDVMAVSDLQVALSIGRNTTYRLVDENKIQHIRIGNQIRIPKIFLIEFVLKSQQ